MSSMPIDGAPIEAAAAPAPQRMWRRLGDPRRRLSVKAAILILAMIAIMATEIFLALRVHGMLENESHTFAHLDHLERELVKQIYAAQDIKLDLQLDLSPEHHRSILEHLALDLAQLPPKDPVVARMLGPRRLAAIAKAISRVEALLILPQISHSTMLGLAREVHEAAGEYEMALIDVMETVHGDRTAYLGTSGGTHQAYFAAMILVGIGGVGAVLIFGGIFVANLVSGLLRLKAQTETIGRGETVQPLPVNRQDELGQVMESVNRMARGLSDRDQQLEKARGNFMRQEKMFALGIFAAQMSHELGNPINAIMALCLHVSESLKDDPRCENVKANLELIEAVAQHAERLAGTVRDIRGFSRSVESHRTLIDLNETVRASVRLMRFEPRVRRLTVDLGLDPSLPAITAVADHISQLIINLLINAADALGNKGIITIRTLHEGSRAILSVQDNGIGMEEAVQRLVFDPFFSTKLGDTGTGLGLTICKRIMEDHSGTITIHSKVGEGTTVVVAFPRSPQE